MIKKNTWLVALLLIVTFWFYSIYWFAQQRKALKETLKPTPKIPSWLWLLIPIIAAIVLSVPIIVTLLLAGIATGVDTYALAIAFWVALFAIFLVPFGIAIWWLVYFGKAVDTYTGGRVPRAWTIALYVFIGPFVILFHQYYSNRVTAGAKVKERKGPSGKFIALAVVLIVISALSDIASFANTPNDILQTQAAISEINGEVKTELNNGSEYITDVNRLTREYEACVDKLEKDFPGELTADNEDEYNLAYKLCEGIRLEQEEFIKASGY